MKKAIILFLLTLQSSVHASQPKDWQLGFQPAVTPLMKDVTWMHDYILLPVIVGISVFVLFLMLYVFVKFREGKNPTPSKLSLIHI